MSLSQQISNQLNTPSLIPLLNQLYSYPLRMDTLIERLENTPFELSPQLEAEIEIIFGRDKINIILLHFLSRLKNTVSQKSKPFLSLQLQNILTF